MGLMDFFIRPEPVSYGTAKGLNTLQINRIAADLRTARDKVNNQMAKRELLEKQREAAVKVKTEAEEQLGVFGLVQILLQKTSDYARQQVKVRIALLDASIRSAHKRMDSAGIGRADLIEHIEHEKVERNEHHGE